MYGQIHCVIRELVQTKFGNEAWETILRKSNLDEHDSFLMFTRYDDASTINLVMAVSETLGVPVEAVLEVFGEFFFDYCLRHGYDKMLRTLGSDIKSFIQNLDSLHSLLALSYRGISAPSFRCEDGLDGELILHYYSGRPGLYPIVKGVVKAVARDLFEQTVEMTIIEQNKEDIGCNQFQEHTAFRVVLRTENKRNEISSDGGNGVIRSLVEFNPDKVLLRATDFCSAFPYHIIFDRDLQIRQCGDLVQKHSNIPLTEGMPLTNAFSIVHPKMVLSIDNIRKFINAVFLLAISPGDNGKKTFLLKGQMIWLSDTQNMIFIGSPRLTSLNELMEMNVYLADIPLYDVTRELVLLNQQRIAEIDIAKRLDETTAELKRTSQALEEEKVKTETLLHQMLPRKVAKALTNGQKVEAEKFDQVTILFSDIVTFTNIASACSPMDVVNMLNDLYQRFDQRTSQHNVYKVETIGDAYMIVSGIPEQTSIHAQPVANFAMDMVEDAGMVHSPATGLPLQIRVGVHTGPVVAGVVGVKMPRYCLFGDTVNTASRMESHGVPGRIHLSPTTYMALRSWGYAFKHRGQMEVKGKGMMSTYFLCGHLDRYLKEPQDDFTDLHLYQDDTDEGDYVDQSHPSRDKLEEKARLVDVGKSVLTDDSVQNLATTEDKHEHKDFCFHSLLDQNKRREEDYDENLEVIDGSYDERNADSSCKNIKTESSQNVIYTDGPSQVVRNKKLSRSSNNSVRFLEDQLPEDDINSLASYTTTKPNPSPSNSLAYLAQSNTSPDCVYVSGSFENEYHSKVHAVGPSLSASADRQHPLHLLVIHETPRRHASEKIETRTHQHSKVDNHENNHGHIKTDPHDSRVMIVTSAPSSQAHNISVAKSDTFPISSTRSSLHQVRPMSGSQGNIKTLNTDTKHKRGKKHRSKLCVVS